MIPFRPCVWQPQTRWIEQGHRLFTIGGDFFFLVVAAVEMISIESSMAQVAFFASQHGNGHSLIS